MRLYRCDMCGEVINERGRYHGDIFLPDGTEVHVKAEVTSIKTLEERMRREERIKAGLPLLAPQYHEPDLCQGCLDKVLAAGGFPARK